MILRWLWPLCLFSLLGGCFLHNDAYLDSSIPRVVTPAGQIAFVRTKWLNGKLQQTTFLDKQNRILEDFVYGRTNEKTLNQYEGDKLIGSTQYYHSDSSEPGYADLVEKRFIYDQTGHVAQVQNSFAQIRSIGITRDSILHRTYYTYRSPVDTLSREFPAPGPYSSTVVNIDRWERNQKGQLIRNFRLYVMKMPHDIRPDTIYYYSHRFSYDKLGRRNLAWYDLMYLGRFYLPAGPDTIRYYYDKQSRLSREIHQYTTDRRNKREIDTTSFDQFNRQEAGWGRQRFFFGKGVLPKNEKTDFINYQYELFDPAKHLPLQISQDIGY